MSIDSALATIDYRHHKLRRAALNPFFSQQSVRALQPVIQERADAVLAALLRYTESNGSTPLNLMYPFSAYTNGAPPRTPLAIITDEQMSSTSMHSLGVTT